MPDYFSHESSKTTLATDVDVCMCAAECKVSHGAVNRTRPVNCTMPALTSGGIQCEGATITGNTFLPARIDVAKSQFQQCTTDPAGTCEYAAVVLAGARGVVVSGNEINGRGALLLGPPANSSIAEDWLAESVHYMGNARFAPQVRMLPLPPQIIGNTATTFRPRLNFRVGSTAAAAAAVAAAAATQKRNHLTDQMTEIGCSTCNFDPGGYASWDSPSVFHRNFCNAGDPSKACITGRELCATGRYYDGKLVYSIAMTGGSQLFSVPLEHMPSLAGQAVYAALRVKPEQNGTTSAGAAAGLNRGLSLGIGLDEQTSMSAATTCAALAGEWVWCVVGATLPLSGDVKVWLRLGKGAGNWTMSDPVLAPIGAPVTKLSSLV
eukprot:COSAG05_NODE_1036_length_6076_cov_159.776476_5_plen_379_part_00